MAKRKKPKKSRPPRTQIQVVTREKVNIQKEATYIIDRAKEQDARIVTLGSLILFSTETGDAWVLDPEDGLALCLARDGTEQPFTLIDTPTQFAIEWNADYRIDGDAFIVADRSGGVRTIIGYPTREILQAMRWIK
jgi:hypothetical protein